MAIAPSQKTHRVPAIFGLDIVPNKDSFRETEFRGRHSQTEFGNERGKGVAAIIENSPSNARKAA
jgi:hypothetical protein